MQVRRGSRRPLLAGALAAVMSLSLLACTPDGEAPPVPRAPSGPEVLSFSVYGPPAVIAAYTRIASDYTAKHPGVVINVRPHEDHQAASAAIREATAKHTLPGLFEIGHEDLPALLKADALEPVDKLLVEREVDFGDGFPRSGMDAFTSDSRLQCMPTEVSPLVAYINTAEVNLGTFLGDDKGEYDPLKGWNLEQFTEVARAASGGRKRGLYIAPTLEQLAPMLISGGGKVVDDDTHPTSLALADDVNSDPLQQILQVVRDPQLTFNLKQLQRHDALQQFRRGRLAIIFGYRDLTARLRQHGGLTFAVMPIPKLGRQVTTARMSAMCIPKDSPRAELAGDFLSYLVSTEPMQTLATTGEFVPSNLDVVNSAAFTQPNLMPENAGVFADQIRRVQNLPDGEGWATVYAQADQALTKLFYDPVIEPISDRLEAIDEASAATLKTLAPTATPSASPSD